MENNKFKFVIATSQSSIAIIVFVEMNDKFLKKDTHLGDFLFFSFYIK